jgi:methyltransferase (TIGR00027 family)
MHEKQPSQTASFVALWRALAHRGFTSAPGFTDPVVGALLSPGWALLDRLLAAQLARSTPEQRARSSARSDAIALRVLAIDAELKRAVAAGAKQLVILGAGLDTRAFRLPLLAEVAVFEVDHPATQAYKQRKALALSVQAKSLSFVSVDFERDALGPRLAAAGHRKDEPTVWVWEGVVMYLGDAALRTTLDDLAAASAATSTLLIHYHEQVPERERSSLENRSRELLLSLWREPQIGLRAPATVHAEVGRVGFAVERDTGSADWAAELGGRPPVGQAARVGRLLVAQRR